MAPAQKRSNFFQFALIFAVVYLGSNLLLRQFFPQQFSGAPAPTGVIFKSTAASITTGHHPVFSIDNHTTSDLQIADRCPHPPVDVFFVGNGRTSIEKLTPVDSDQNAVPCVTTPPIPAGGSTQLSLAPWKYSIFDRQGTYEVRLPLAATGAALKLPATHSGALQGNQLTARFDMVEPGVFTKLFRTFIMAPFLNFLIFAASILPDHNLGLAIIILTIVVKLLLFFPTQKSMEGQKKMQMLQPKLEDIKKQHPNNPEKVQQETMRLWKEEGINPLSSCLPTLLQFPILIGLFYVIRDGSTLELSRHLIYPIYQHLDWKFGTSFLGLDLLKPNIYVMPPLLVILQFLQMKLAFSIVKKKQAAQQKIVDVPTRKEKSKEPPSSQDMQQKMMMYGLPLMIGFFAFKFPAAVSLYYGVTTLFGIGQQLIVNREHLTVRTKTV